MIGMRKLDHRIGPARGWGHIACGFNPSPNFDPQYECGSLLVVRHMMINDVDEDGYHPGIFSCAEHELVMPEDLVRMKHPIAVFCGIEGSEWNLELNECQMPIETFELALLGTLDLGKDIDEDFKRDPTRFRELDASPRTRM